MAAIASKVFKAGLAGVLALSLSVLANVGTGHDCAEGKTTISVQKKAVKKAKKNIKKAKAYFSVKVFLHYRSDGNTVNRPLPTVKYKGKTLTRGKDYKVSWKYYAVPSGVVDNRLKITIKGKGAYKGTKTIVKKVTYHWNHKHKYARVVINGSVDHYRCKTCGDKIKCDHHFVSKEVIDGHTWRYCDRCCNYITSYMC